MHSTAPVLFESSDYQAVLQGPVNNDWVRLIEAIDGERFKMLARCDHLDLCTAGTSVPCQLEIVAEGKQQALKEMFATWEQRKTGRGRAGGGQLPETMRDVTSRHHR